MSGKFRVCNSLALDQEKIRIFLPSSAFDYANMIVCYFFDQTNVKVVAIYESCLIGFSPIKIKKLI